MKEDLQASGSEQSSELLILNDGNILVHNLTRTMAELLTELNPEDATHASARQTGSRSYRP